MAEEKKCSGCNALLADPHRQGCPRLSAFCGGTVMIADCRVAVETRSREEAEVAPAGAEPLFHGPELDAAMDAANKLLPLDLGVCDAALSARKDPVIDQTLQEGIDPERAAEIKKMLMDAGQPFDDDLVSTIQIRGTTGGAFSYGISTGLLLERNALAQNLLNGEVIEAVAERLWNEREFRDPTGGPPDDWCPPGHDVHQPPPHEPDLWAEVVREGRYPADVRECCLDARRALESVVERLDKPPSQREWPEITPEARRMAETAQLMERPELQARHAQVALEVIGCKGQELVTVGTKYMLDQLTEVCPDCEGDDSGGGIDEPPSAMSSCETCVWGRVPKGMVRQRDEELD